MVRQRVWLCVRAIPIGWVTLLVITYLLERPLLLWAAPILGGSWFATAQLALDCCALAVSGWVTSYLSRDGWFIAVLSFALTLTLWDFTPLLAINVPWLLHAVINVFSDSRYLGGFVTTATSHALLFGSLFAGAVKSRPVQTPPSIIGDP
jgi:hypothetical protein